MFSYEMTFDRIVNMENNATVKEMITFKCKQPIHIFPSMDLISILPKGIIVDCQTIQLKLLEEIKDEERLPSQAPASEPIKTKKRRRN